VRYGGNTSCIEIRAADDAPIILDAGTGIRPLGATLVREGVTSLDLLLTHLHLDHIEGLGFFAPLFEPDCTIRIWGPRPDADRSLEQHVATYLSPPFFPVPFERIPAAVTFTEVRGEAWRLAGVDVECTAVCHPGPTVAYRLTRHGRSLAYIPDNEPGLDHLAGMRVAQRADVLLHDAQYTDEEYTTRVGWGHTALNHFAAYVRAAQPRRAFMFHHDPSHDDAQLDSMHRTARDLCGSVPVDICHEGLELVFD
jgi:phosphoribosyl 1,2-cyclic phosphodiesterase